MAISVSRSRVKERCGIADSAYDSQIDNLIADHLPAIEYAVRPEHLADASAGLVATMNLGATEIVCGELLALLAREPGASARITLGPITYEDLSKDLADGYGLKRQGWARLTPYLKEDPAGRGALRVAGSSGGRGAAGPL